jgi:beta-glucosidase
VDADSHLMFLEPVLRGGYPPESAGPRAAARAGDLALIGAPVDFLGVNYYRRMLVRAVPEPPLRAEVVLPDGVPVTMNDWPVQPDGLRDLLVGLRDGYPGLPPVYITENGAAYPAEIDDQARIDYLRRHLLALHAAITAGVDVRGYFLWTLMDNFEWAEGYATRFGIVRVDRDDLRRTPRTSARWYSEVARENGLP